MSTPRAKPKPTPKLVGMHVRVPEPLYKLVLAYHDKMRKQNPMRNLSDAVRALLEKGIEQS
jgi:hypothetical protein